MRTKLLSNAGYAAELHKNAQKSHFCKLYKLQFANFSIRPRQVFASFEQLLSNSRYLQKATFDCFEKLRETFWKISSNLWKALAEVPMYPLFLAETYLRNAAFRYPETVFDWLHHQLHHSHLLFSIVSHPSLPRSCPFHSFFFLSFSFFLFFRWAVFISLVSTLPRQTLSLMRCRSPPPAYT